MDDEHERLRYTYRGYFIPSYDRYLSGTVPRTPVAYHFTHDDVVIVSRFLHISEPNAIAYLHRSRGAFPALLNDNVAVGTVATMLPARLGE